MKEAKLCFTFLGSGHALFYIVPSGYGNMTQDGSGCHTFMLADGAHTVFFTLNTGTGGDVKVYDAEANVIASDKFEAGYYSGYVEFTL